MHLTAYIRMQSRLAIYFWRRHGVVHPAPTPAGVGGAKAGLSRAEIRSRRSRATACKSVETKSRRTYRQSHGTPRRMYDRGLQRVMGHDQHWLWIWQTALCFGLLQPCTFCLHGIAPALSQLCACSASRNLSSRYFLKSVNRNQLAVLPCMQSNCLLTANNV